MWWPICLSILAGRCAADKEGLDRLFNSPTSSAGKEGDNQGKGNNGKAEKDTNKKEGKPTNNPKDNSEKQGDKKKEDSDKNLEEKGDEKPVEDKQKEVSKKGNVDNNGNGTQDKEKEIVRPDTRPIYAACWSPDYVLVDAGQINKIWWCSNENNNNPLKFYSEKLRQYRAMIPEDYRYLISRMDSDLQKQKNIITSAKSAEICRQNPEYNRIQKDKKRLAPVSETKFLSNTLKNFTSKNLIAKTLGMAIGEQTKATNLVMKKTEIGIQRNSNFKAGNWCQGRNWCRNISNLPERSGDKNRLLVTGVALDITDNRNEYKKYIPGLGSSQEEYSKPFCLAEPIKEFMSSPKVDLGIKSIIRLGAKIRNPWRNDDTKVKVVSDGVIYAKDKLIVDKLAKSFEKRNQHNLEVDQARAKAIIEAVNKYKEAEEAYSRHSMAKFNRIIEGHLRKPNSGDGNHYLPAYPGCVEIPGLFE
ncbi:MAG: hypothetical protein AB2992_06760 [Candidatus Symbiodolus clandestinus]